MADSQDYRRQFRTRSVVFIMTLLGILVVLSLMSARLNSWKLDLTSDKIHTLSEPFKRIAGGLKDKVTINYYCSEELPEVLLNLPRDTIDLLDEINAITLPNDPRGEGFIEYNVIHPEKKAEEVAREKVEKYKRVEADGGDLDELEPKPADTMADLFRGGLNQKKTPDKIREARAQRAAAMAEKTEREIDDVRYEILRQEYQEHYESSLMDEGVFPMRFDERSGSSVREVTFYSTLEIRYKKDREVIPRFFMINALELELGQRVLKLTLPSKPKVAFFDGRAPDEQPPANPFQAQQGPRSEYHSLVNDVLQNFFDSRMIKLKEGDGLEDLERKLLDEVKEERKRRGDSETGAEEEAKISCLIIAQPDKLEERQVYEISKAISRGIPTILLISRHSLDVSGGLEAGYPITFLDPGLDDLLREYGLELNRPVLGSNVHSNFLAAVQVPGLNLRMRRPYPFYCMVLATARDKLLRDDHVFLNRIPNMVFPMTNGLTINQSRIDGINENRAEQDQITIEKLAWVDSETWAVEVSPFSQNPFGRGASPTTLLGDHSTDLVFDAKRRQKSATKDDVAFVDRRELGIFMKGKFPFLYEGKEIPDWKPVEETPSGAPGMPGMPGMPPGGFPPGIPGLPPGHPPPGSGGPQGEPGDLGEPAPAPPVPAPAPPVPAPAPPVPAPEVAPAGDTAAPPPPDAAAEPKKPTAHVEVVPGQLLVLATVDGFKDYFLRVGQDQGAQCPGFTSNLTFFRNAIETYGLGQDLIDIRRKNLTARRFSDDADEAAQLWIQIVNIGLVPGLVGLVGLTLFLLRRREANAYERLMKGA